MFTLQNCNENIKIPLVFEVNSTTIGRWADQITDGLKLSARKHHWLLAFKINKMTYSYAEFSGFLNKNNLCCFVSAYRILEDYDVTCILCHICTVCVL